MLHYYFIKERNKFYDYKLFLIDDHLIFVLDKMLKGIRVVHLDNRKVFRAPGPKTKYFEQFYFCLSINLNIVILRKNAGYELKCLLYTFLCNSLLIFIVYCLVYSLLNDKKRCSKYLIIGPGAPKNLSVIESHTTNTVLCLVQDGIYKLKISF